MEIFQKKFIETSEIPLALNEAFRFFNEAFDTDFSEANIITAYFTFENFPSVYKEICEQHFPSWLSEDYTNPQFYNDAQAMALVNGNKGGILINTSVQFSFYEWVESLTHELSHIFAVQSEYYGRDFYLECCSNPQLSPAEDMLYVGYTVWKEFIADYLTVFATPYKPLIPLYRYRGEINRFDSMVTNLNKTSLKALSLVLVAIFTSKEFLTTKSKEDFLETLIKRCSLNMSEYHDLINTVFDHLRDANTDAHIINEEFIDDIGSLVRRIVVGRKLAQNWHARADDK